MPSERQSEDREQTGQHDKPMPQVSSVTEEEEVVQTRQLGNGVEETHKQQQRREDSNQLFYFFFKALVTEDGTKKEHSLSMKGDDFKFFCNCKILHQA